MSKTYIKKLTPKTKKDKIELLSHSSNNTKINSDEEIKLYDVPITKPFLKWVGGKSQIIGEVLNKFPKTINNYYEPFLGGGSVLLALLSYVKYKKIVISGKVICGDINYNLIGLYQNIQMNPLILITEIKKLVDEYSKIEGDLIDRKPINIENALTSKESYYYWIRNKFNKLSVEDKIKPVGSAMLLFLNKTCFRGIYREGPRGFNVPYGNYKNPIIYDEKQILTISELIKEVEFKCCSFTELLSDVNCEDFIYLDPPYAPENEKSFVSYTSDGFDLENHKKLFNVCIDMNTKNIKFLMSNSDVKLVKDNFMSDCYEIKTLLCRRAINSKNPESKTNEILINN